MGTSDKIQNKTQELTGKAKQAVGGATGDPALKRQGQRDEKSGQVKQVGEKVKDVFR